MACRRQRHGRPGERPVGSSRRRSSTPVPADWADIARVFSATPASIGGLAGYDAGISVGAPANFTLYDPSASRAFETEQLRGRGVNSPFLGMTLPGRIVATVHRGYPTVLDGELVEEERVAADAGGNLG